MSVILTGREELSMTLFSGATQYDVLKSIAREAGSHKDKRAYVISLTTEFDDYVDDSPIEYATVFWGAE